MRIPGRAERRLLFATEGRRAETLGLFRQDLEQHGGGAEQVADRHFQQRGDHGLGHDGDLLLTHRIAHLFRRAREPAVFGGVLRERGERHERGSGSEGDDKFTHGESPAKSVRTMPRGR